VYLCAALAVSLLIGWYYAEKYAKEPVLPLHLFKNSVFTMCSTIGFVMRRIKYYRFLGTLGAAVMIVGMYLLAQVGPSTPEWHVVVALVVVGAGIGVTFPLYLTAVQVALPRQFMGVASSQIQFWRNLGGTVGSAILGAVLSNRLPGYMATRLSESGVPPQVIRNVPNTGNANAILDPTLLAKLPPAIVHAIRAALADSLHDIYVFAGAILVLALIAKVFMKEVSLQTAKPAAGFEAPPVEVEPPREEAEEEEREGSVAAG